jgi:hypothetical protein
MACAPVSRRSLVLSGALALAGAFVRPRNAARSSGALAQADLVRNGLPIISRDAWGCPDGEVSPNWVPAIARPFHLILHHTADDVSVDDGLSTILNIWNYHTYGLGWGDIGYNYLIDPLGAIYEGRAGGDDVVGAHTHNFNYGSVGIALMGNYDNAKPTPGTLGALIRLLTMLANKYGIDAQATFDGDGATYPSIGGHRDFNETDCPGGNVYTLLPKIRVHVAHRLRSNCGPASGTSIFVHAGAPAVATLIVRNTGTTTWNGRYSLQLLAGGLPGMPTGYNLSDVGPNGTITIPLFLPPLETGAIVPMHWQLADMEGNLVGRPFSTTVEALAPSAPLPAGS